MKEDTITKKETKQNFKEVLCKVLVSTIDSSMIEINGYGITIPLTKEEYVTIKYTGTIGKKDFKIIK